MLKTIDVTFPSEKAFRSFIELNRECFYVKEQIQLPSGQVSVKLFRQKKKPQNKKTIFCGSSPNEEQQILF